MTEGEFSFYFKLLI